MRGIKITVTDIHKVEAKKAESNVNPIQRYHNHQKYELLKGVLAPLWYKEKEVLVTINYGGKSPIATIYGYVDSESLDAIVSEFRVGKVEFPVAKLRQITDVTEIREITDLLIPYVSADTEIIFK